MSNAMKIFLRKAVAQKGIPFLVNTDSQGFGGLTPVVCYFLIEND
jgi:antitoxin component of RelBE/YafQ-DinJ toxin-antitoxin module